ncbi:MAG: asparaginase [Verrucomicrobia bacterium]|nr:asparaginase [Verrucomicrobiota bacterium]
MNEDQKIVVVGTGGTIASRYNPSQGRVVASKEVEEIVGVLPGQEGLPRLEFQNFAKISGFEMTIEVAHGLVKHVAGLLANPEVGGVVVTQGTDTIEETSFLADLLLPPGKPVVFTGAQLPNDHPQTDGPRNILDSARAAASPEAVGLGVMVCFNGRLHAARDVTKVHTSALETFQSYDHGALGSVDEKDVVIFRRPMIRLTLSAEKLDKRVDLIRLVIGIDARAIDAATAAGVDGLVVEAFGRGNATTAFGRGVSRACSAGVPVVVTSRCPSGRVKAIYGSGGGGGRDLEDAGAIFAGDLRGPKARILLMVALSDPSARMRLRELFYTIAP